MHSERSSRRRPKNLAAVTMLALASCGSGTALVLTAVGDEVHLDNPFQSDGSSSSNPALGQFPNPQAPGSLLLFPFVRELGGFSRTYVSITNTNLSSSVRVELHLVDGQSCVAQVPVIIAMTAGDTWTAVVGAVTAPGTTPTFGWAVATDASGRPIAFNHLAGNVQEVFDNDVTGEIKVGTPGFAFQSVRAEGSVTDVDADGHWDLDGVEYSPMPDSFVFPGIVSQSTSGFFNDSLVVLSLAGPGAVSGFDVAIRNDVGATFSAQGTTGCWSEIPLATVSASFLEAFLASQVNDPAEVVGEQREACWFSVRPTPTAVGQPPLGGIFVFVIHKTLATDTASSVQMPFYIGRGANVEVQF